MIYYYYYYHHTIPLVIYLYCSYHHHNSFHLILLCFYSTLGNNYLLPLHLFRRRLGASSWSSPSSCIHRLLGLARPIRHATTSSQPRHDTYAIIRHEHAFRALGKEKSEWWTGLNDGTGSSQGALKHLQVSLLPISTISYPTYLDCDILTVLLLLSTRCSSILI